MSTAQQFLAVANSQLGVKEDPPGSNVNKFTQWFGVTGAWCAMFQSWCFAQVGMGEIRSAWVDDFVTNAQNRRWGAWIGQYDPIMPGDLAIFDWDGGYSDHIAAVDDVLPGGRWVSIEGNWADQVTKVTRGRDNIRGFVRPHWSPAPTKPTPPPVNTQDSPTVRTYQAQLNVFLHAQKHPSISVDGIPGPVTSKALTEFQTFANGMYAYAGKDKRIAVDGVYGPETAPVLAWWAVVLTNPPAKKLPVPSGTPLLKSGSPSSDRTRQLQTALNRVMKSGLTVDGEYGPKTKAAVQAYQKHAKLSADGIYGPDTAKALGGEKAL